MTHGEHDLAVLAGLFLKSCRLVLVRRLLDSFDNALYDRHLTSVEVRVEKIEDHLIDSASLPTEINALESKERPSQCRTTTVVDMVT
jgi:hypothetical protein